MGASFHHVTPTKFVEITDPFRFRPYNPIFILGWGENALVLEYEECENIYEFGAKCIMALAKAARTSGFTKNKALLITGRQSFYEIYQLFRAFEEYPSLHPFYFSFYSNLRSKYDDKGVMITCHANENQ